MEWNRPLKTVGTRIAVIATVGIALFGLYHLMNNLALWAWHRFGGDRSVDCLYYFQCLSDEEFLSSWSREVMLAKFLTVAAICVVLLVLWVLYSLFLEPFVDEFRRSKGYITEEAKEEVSSEEEETSSEPVFCQTEFCGCVEHKGGTLPYPPDFWDAHAGHWIIPSSSCTNPDCTCPEYHEGQEFNYTAGFWVRKNNN